MLRHFASLAILLSAVAAQAADIAPAYHATKTVALGAPDRWDYVVFDPGSDRVYVSHGDRITVVDGKSGAILGQIEGMPGGTHGIGISAANGKGYTDDGKAGQAVAFDLKTLKTGARIAAKDDADGIAFDPTSGHIFVVDGDSAALTVIDPKTDAAIATIATGGGMEYAVAGDNGKLYVNGADKKEIVRIDTATNRVDAHWPVPGCTSPHGLAIDKAAHRLFPTCLNAVMNVVDTDSGKVVASLPIGQGTDGAAFDPKRKLVFSSNYDGTPRCSLGSSCGRNSGAACGCIAILSSSCRSECSSSRYSFWCWDCSRKSWCGPISNRARSRVISSASGSDSIRQPSRSR